MWLRTCSLGNGNAAPLILQNPTVLLLVVFSYKGDRDLQPMNFFDSLTNTMPTLVVQNGVSLAHSPPPYTLNQALESICLGSRKHQCLIRV